VPFLGPLITLTSKLRTGWFDTGNGFAAGGEFLFDAEIAANVYEGVDLIVGVQNLLDNYPDENPGQGGSGQLYPEAAPFGFNGGQASSK